MAVSNLPRLFLQKIKAPFPPTEGLGPDFLSLNLLRLDQNHPASYIVNLVAICEFPRLRISAKYFRKASPIAGTKFFQDRSQVDGQSKEIAEFVEKGVLLFRPHGRPP